MKLYRNLKIQLIALIIVNFYFSQNTYDLISEKPDSNSVISKHFNNSKIHFIGEWHYQEENFFVFINYLKWLNSLKIYPKYIIKEEGESISYLRNLYLQTGDNKILSLIFGSDMDKEQMICMKKYYESLSIDKRFVFKGSDGEYFPNCVHYTIKYLIDKKHDSIIEKIFLNKEQSRDVINSILKKNDPEVWESKEILNDIESIISLNMSSDSLLLMQLFEENYLEFKVILDGYMLEKKGKSQITNDEIKNVNQKREKYIADRVYSYYIMDTNSYYLLQYGLDHIKLSTEIKSNNYQLFYNFATMLNYQKDYYLANNKVVTNLIFYPNRKRFYNNLNLNYKQLNDILNRIKKNQLIFVSSTKFKGNNILLIKNQ